MKFGPSDRHKFKSRNFLKLSTKKNPKKSPIFLGIIGNFSAIFFILHGYSMHRSTCDFIVDLSIPNRYIANISTIFSIFFRYSSHLIIGAQNCFKVVRFSIYQLNIAKKNQNFSPWGWPPFTKYNHSIVVEEMCEYLEILLGKL